MRIMVVGILAAVFAVGAGSVSSPAATQAVTDATGAALQADGQKAVAILSAIPAEEFVGAERAFRSCVLERLGTGSAVAIATDVPHPFVRKLLAIYRSYWRASLLAPDRQTAAEGELLRALRELLGRADLADLNAAEPVLAGRLKLAGYHSLQGKTGRLRELMLWTKQEQRSYRVELPEGTHDTRVELLDGFVSAGWSAFATCDRRGAGGWATTDALFAVVPRYESIDGEEFRATFLGHETQHFADLKRFPGLQPWELEYRAKLTELALASATQPKILRNLAETQGDDPQSPHAYANKRVLVALERRLAAAPGSAGADRLRQAAITELRDDSRRRVAPAPPAD